MSAHPAFGTISIHVVDGRLVTGENPTSAVLLSAKARCGCCVQDVVIALVSNISLG